MTTTLRPEGPEERTRDGGRAQSFHIRVNGRRVGSLRLSAAPPAAGGAGRVEDLAVEPGERRRGRATVALLAAEEVLRSWHCPEALAEVPAEATGPRALADGLGWRERNRTMLKRLSGPEPALPSGVSVRDLDREEYPGWLAAERAALLRGPASAGLRPEEAETRAARAYATYLPDGPDTKDTALRVLLHEGVPAGSLWLSLAPAVPRPGVEAWVFSVEVAARHRGRGLGRALMLDAERLCLAAGREVLGLNVYTGNTPALRLYTSLGYRATLSHLHKPLG